MSHRRKKKCYTLCNFVVDVVLTVCTGGLWLVWIFCREMRNR